MEQEDIKSQHPMLKAILKPFIKILFKKNIALSRWSLLKTLVLLSVMKRFRKNDKGVKVKLGNYFINAPDYHVISLLLKEKFGDDEYFFQSDNAQPVIIDCGANIGISVLYFKILYPDSQIHCFEPYETAYDYLVKNVEENHLSGVFLYRMAVSDTDGELPLYIPVNENVINATVVKNVSGQSHNTVQSIKLSSFLSRLNEVDLVKLDIEGAETGVINDLHNSGELSSGKIKRFAIEYHTLMNGSQVKQFSEMLTNSAYKLDIKIIYPKNTQSDLLLTATLKGKDAPIS
jgi:FkbM family methyltransferase